MVFFYFLFALDNKINKVYVLPSFWVGFISLFSGNLIIDPLMF